MHISFKNQNISILKLDSDPKLKKVSSLDLSNNKIESLEINAFVCFTALTHLDLSNNLLSELPYQWPSPLQYLDVSNNKLSRISGLESCSELDTLLISGNQIHSLKGLGGAMGKRLRVLDVSHNMISSLDFNPKNVSSLKILNASKNNIQMLEDIRVLARIRLKELWLQHNAVTIRTPQFQSVIIGLVPCLEKLDGNIIEHGEVNKSESIISYRLNFEKIRNKRKEDALNKSLAGGVNQNFSILNSSENASETILNNNNFNQISIEELDDNTKDLNSQTKTNINTLNSKSPSKKRSNENSIKLENRKNSFSSNQSPLKQRNLSTTSKQQSVIEVTDSNDNMISLTEYEELRSENDQLRAMLQELRFQIASKDETINKRNEDLKKLQKTIETQSKILAQEKILSKTSKTELSQIQRELRRVKKIESEIRRDQNSSLNSSKINSKTLNSSNMKSPLKKDITNLNDTITNLKQIVSEKDRKILQLKDKIKQRASETKKDMEELMKYVAEFQKFQPNIDIKPPNPSTSKVIIINKEEKKNPNEQHKSPLHHRTPNLKTENSAHSVSLDNESIDSVSSTLEEAEKIANEILIREFSGKLPTRYNKSQNSNKDDSSILQDIDHSESIVNRKISKSTKENIRNNSNLKLQKNNTSFNQTNYQKDNWSESSLSKESDGLMVSSIHFNQDLFDASTDEPFLNKIQGIYTKFNYNSLSPFGKSTSAV